MRVRATMEPSQGGPTPGVVFQLYSALANDKPSSRNNGGPRDRGDRRSYRYAAKWDEPPDVLPRCLNRFRPVQWLEN